MTRTTASLTLGLALAALAGSAQAQGIHSFLVDSPASGFTYGGNVNALGISGPIEGVPNNTFNVAGSLDVDLTVVGGVPTTGAIVPGGTIFPTADLAAQIPNPIPFLPPLATIDVTGVTISLETQDPVTLAPSSFAIVGGAFTADVAATVLTGSAAVDILGSVQIIDLAGTVTPPQAVSGTIVPTLDGFQASVPLNISVSLDDPGTGATGNFDLNGTAVGEWRPLNSTTSAISVASGGTQEMVISTGGPSAGDPYLVLGSTSGTFPGLPLGAVTLPLNPDAFFNLSLSSASTAPFVNTFGFLDADGMASASFVLPTGLNPATAGTHIDWAYAAFDVLTLNVEFASNALGLDIIP